MIVLGSPVMTNNFIYMFIYIFTIKETNRLVSIILTIIISNLFQWRQEKV